MPHINRQMSKKRTTELRTLYIFVEKRIFEPKHMPIINTVVVFRLSEEPRSCFVHSHKKSRTSEPRKSSNSTQGDSFGHRKLQR